MNGRLQLVQRAAASDAAREVNEDAFGLHGNALWVLDGATGVSDVQCTPGPTDAAWLAQHVSAWLQREADTAGSIGDRMPALQAAMTHDFDLVCATAQATDADLPCTCAAVVQLIQRDARQAEAEIEISVIGDITVLVAAPGAAVQRFSDDRAQPFGERSLQAWRRATAESDDPGRWWASTREVIVGNRASVNRAGGYWVVHPRRPWAAEVQRHRVAAPVGTRVLALSDGAYRLVDLFARFDDGKLLQRAFEDGGVASLMAELRALERADAGGRRFARVKPSDDATLIAAEVTAEIVGEGAA